MGTDLVTGLKRREREERREMRKEREIEEFRERVLHEMKRREGYRVMMEEGRERERERESQRVHFPFLSSSFSRSQMAAQTVTIF
jgi:hypothetical protein